HVLISSSTQEQRENSYGKSKKKTRSLLMQWAKETNACMTGLVIPNVYGPFGKPFYNSFIATFCHQLTCGEEPEIKVDVEVKLIYVQELVWQIVNKIRTGESNPRLLVESTAIKKVSEVLRILKGFK